MRKDKKCENLSRFFVGMEKFSFGEMHIGEKSMGKTSRFVYYFEDLLKSGNRALVQNKTFISL